MSLTPGRVFLFTRCVGSNNVKDYDTTVCFFPGCEESSVGQIVFVGNESWFSEIVLCGTHAQHLEDEAAAVTAYVQPFE